MLCMGGINMSDQYRVLEYGVHIVVATPGRLLDCLEKNSFDLDLCKYLCLDEADRMIDLVSDRRNPRDLKSRFEAS